MIVCIAEKPSVAKEIANILGAKEEKEGYYEGNNYQVTWTFGHLCELKNPYEYSISWKNWNLDNLPIIPKNFAISLKNDDGIQKQFNIIKKLMLKAEQIINCGDAGQEGEVIQRWVMQKIGIKCPVKRLWINSLTENAIKEGFKHLREDKEYQSLYEAGVCRAIGDWILGMNMTRLYTLKYGKNNQILSIGRVQTPTLSMIVSREKEINDFIAEPYWLLSTNFKNTNFQSNLGQIKDKEEANTKLNEIKNKDFIITNIITKEEKEAPPHLYDLTSLQVDCNKKYGFSAEQTLQTIQSLYEKKITTYPRVDTTYLSEDIYPKCESIIDNIFGYSKLKEGVIKPLPKRKRFFDDSKVTDHHAIIPTGIFMFGLTHTEELVYELILKSFLAAFYDDYKFNQTIVTGKIGEIEFKATGKQTVELGWKKVYDIKEKKEQELNFFTIGEIGNHKPKLEEKETTPPKLYTEASLLRAMETAGQFVEDEKLKEALKENGIGRPSSRAAIIETLFKRNYLKRDNKNVISTPLGQELIKLIKEDLIKSPKLTGVWEKKLRDIEHKKYKPSQFIEELSDQIKDIIKQEKLN